MSGTDGKDRGLAAARSCSVRSDRERGGRTQLLKTTNDIYAPAIVWEEPVTISAEEALAANTSKSDAAPARVAAEEFLGTVLADKPLPVRQIEAEAREAGLSWATVKRARDALGIKTNKTALDGGWVWELPNGQTE